LADIGGAVMAINFNHTIVSARDSKRSATFLAEILDLPGPTRWGPFEVVRTDNEANIDFMTVGGEIATQHYAFLVSEPEFDAIFGRVRERGLTYWSDPAQSRQNEINHHDGGRGFYFEDPDGHLLEIITRPYGSGGWNP
jgi:catechol 2,3-dioxygenase-like lactoylglutathione lyase family enzyme